MATLRFSHYFWLRHVTVEWKKSFYVNDWMCSSNSKFPGVITCCIKDESVGLMFTWEGAYSMFLDFVLLVRDWCAGFNAHLCARLRPRPPTLHMCLSELIFQSKKYPASHNGVKAKAAPGAVESLLLDVANLRLMYWTVSFLKQRMHDSSASTTHHGLAQQSRYVCCTIATQQKPSNHI